MCVLNARVAQSRPWCVQASPAHAEALGRSQGANMLSFKYPSGQDVSVLVSKNGGRYRLQSSCLEAMWLVLQVTPVWLLMPASWVLGKQCTSVSSQCCMITAHLL